MERHEWPVGTGAGDLSADPGVALKLLKTQNRNKLCKAQSTVSRGPRSVGQELLLSPGSLCCGPSGSRASIVGKRNLLY